MRNLTLSLCRLSVGYLVVLLLSFKATSVKPTIGNPSTRHALLPALALMVGHSSATTTISNYVHLTHYWRWIATEGELRSLKILDNEIQALVGMDKSYFSRRKINQACQRLIACWMNYSQVSK